MNTVLASELLAMEKADLDMREKLAADGSLFEGYHPQMKAVHDKNAIRLSEIIKKYGWPGKSMVGEEAAYAAWLVLQHAIAHPTLQRHCLTLLKPLVLTGEVGALEVAMLEDRIRSFEDKPQLYGTQFDWNEEGEMSPLPIDDPLLVDERRRQLGLRPLAEETKQRRQYIQTTPERPPKDLKSYKQERKNWLIANGWQ
ncbi:MAG TPA: DUF6624 domain-containing protein [Flavisolibacter sp.]|nr:DUF6624 domain-containing protein [Flavisolibacter sp.]